MQSELVNELGAKSQIIPLALLLCLSPSRPLPYSHVLSLFFLFARVAPLRAYLRDGNLRFISLSLCECHSGCEWVFCRAPRRRLHTSNTRAAAGRSLLLERAPNRAHTLCDREKKEEKVRKTDFVSSGKKENLNLKFNAQTALNFLSSDFSSRKNFFVKKVLKN